MKKKIVIEISVDENNDCGWNDCPMYDTDADGCKLNDCYMDGRKRMKECLKAEKEYNLSFLNDR